MTPDEKPRRGRRPLDPSVRRAATVALRIRPESLARWRAAAARSGQSLPDWLREAADDCAAAGEPPAV